MKFSQPTMFDVSTVVPTGFAERIETITFAAISGSVVTPVQQTAHLYILSFSQCVVATDLFVMLKRRIYRFWSKCLGELCQSDWAFKEEPPAPVYLLSW